MLVSQKLGAGNNVDFIMDLVPVDIAASKMSRVPSLKTEPIATMENTEVVKDNTVPRL